MHMWFIVLKYDLQMLDHYITVLYLPWWEISAEACQLNTESFTMKTPCLLAKQNIEFNPMIII